MKNKIILFITITIVTILSGYFIYNSYSSYKNYKIAQNGDKYISYIEKINDILKSIETESASSAMYLGKNGKIDFLEVQSNRDKTDSLLKNVNQFTTNNPKFSSNLQYVRSRVDVVNSDYRDILISSYQDEISNSVLKEITQNTKKLSLGLTNLEKELFAYSDFITYRNSISKEKSFILYMLSSSKKMQNQDLLLWNSILSKDKLPKSTELQTHLKLQDFSDFDSSIRLDIARGISTGDYKVTPEKWLEKINQKIDRVIQSEDKLYNHIQSKLKDKTSYPKGLIYNIAISLFLLLFLILLLRSYKSNSKKREITQDIVKKRENYTTENGNIIRKKRMSDVSKSNTLFDKTQHSEIKQRATDIPLSNSTKIDESISKEDKSTISAFNPMEEFAHIVNSFTDKTDKKGISFKYQIDSTIPTYCIGDIYKIHQILEYLMKYAIKSSNSKKFLTFSIDNIAQTKIENAIRFSLKQDNTNFTKEEIREIKNSRYANFSRSINLSKEKENLIKVSKLISSIDGNFHIINNVKNKTEFQITVNLKRE